jgi:hypothetical protein
MRTNDYPTWKKIIRSYVDLQEKDENEWNIWYYKTRLVSKGLK